MTTTELIALMKCWRRGQATTEEMDTLIALGWLRITSRPYGPARATVRGRDTAFPEIRGTDAPIYDDKID